VPTNYLDLTRGVDVDRHCMSKYLLEDYDYAYVSNSESKVPARRKRTVHSLLFSKCTASLVLTVSEELELEWESLSKGVFRPLDHHHLPRNFSQSSSEEMTNTLARADINPSMAMAE
jgi:hypothetical protein